jgi:hypothetical protein
MIRNEIDDFRQQFFEKVIADKQQQEREEKQKQAKCFHVFNMVGLVLPNGYQERTCSKCGLSAVKRVKVWEGTKGCTIS